MTVSVPNTDKIQSPDAHFLQGVSDLAVRGYVSCYQRCIQVFILSSESSAIGSGDVGSPPLRIERVLI